MANDKTNSKPTTVVVFNGTDHAIQIAYTRRGEALPAVAGVVPMNPGVPEVVRLLPGINFADAAELRKAAGPRGVSTIKGLRIVTLEGVDEMAAAPMIEVSNAPALRRWRSEHAPSPEVAKLIGERLTAIEASKAQHAREAA